MPFLVRQYLNQLTAGQSLEDISPLIAEMRMIKSPDELRLARHAGEVAMAMMQAGKEAIGHGVPEYEVALATSIAGTRKSAELLQKHYADSSMSPNTHFLQIMASGEEITRTHHRASNRIMQRGDPVFLCFCGMTNFHRFKLGFDRTFWIDKIADDTQESIYQVAVDSQAAALAELRPGVVAEDVHAAYAEVIQSAGYDYPFRCGRGTGFSYLEKPQLVMGVFKEIDIRFVMGYTPLEYRDTLHMIAEGKVNCAPMITGVVGLEGVDSAFTALGNPEKHAKILIDPKSAHVEPVSV